MKKVLYLKNNFDKWIYLFIKTLINYNFKIPSSAIIHYSNAGIFMFWNKLFQIRIVEYNR